MSKPKQKQDIRLWQTKFFVVLEFHAASSSGVESRGILSDDAAELTGSTRGLKSACMCDWEYIVASEPVAVKEAHRKASLLICTEHAHCISFFLLHTKLARGESAGLAHRLDRYVLFQTHVGYVVCGDSNAGGSGCDTVRRVLELCIGVHDLVHRLLVLELMTKHEQKRSAYWVREREHNK